MRQKKILFGLLLAFALLLGGAYALYTRLGQSMAPGRLAGEEPAASEGASGSASQRTPPQISPSTTGRETRSICLTTPASRWC